jgi:hypothetical protein
VADLKPPFHFTTTSDRVAKFLKSVLAKDEMPREGEGLKSFFILNNLFVRRYPRIIFKVDVVSNSIII